MRVQKSTADLDDENIMTLRHNVVNLFLEPLRNVRICDIVDNMSEYELEHAIQK